MTTVAGNNQDGGTAGIDKPKMPGHVDRDNQIDKRFFKRPAAVKCRCKKIKQQSSIRDHNMYIGTRLWTDDISPAKRTVIVIRAHWKILNTSDILPNDTPNRRVKDYYEYIRKVAAL